MINEDKDVAHGRDTTTEILREGGAVVSVDIRIGENRWHGRQVIPGAELEQSLFTKTTHVKKAVEQIAKAIDVETPGSK